MNGFKKTFKKTGALLMTASLFFSFAACSGDKAEYESIRGFAFHFYPEEYEEEYSEVSKTLSLDADMDYQLQLDATCESGTMEISIMDKNEEAKAYTVNPETPCHELLTIAANATGEVTIIVAIAPETKGEVIGDLLARAK